eukprot:IDg18121t1
MVDVLWSCLSLPLLCSFAPGFEGLLFLPTVFTCRRTAPICGFRLLAFIGPRYACGAGSSSSAGLGSTRTWFVAILKALGAL